jgi:hypothetical protein
MIDWKGLHTPVFMAESFRSRAFRHFNMLGWVTPVPEPEPCAPDGRHVKLE